MDTGSAQNQPPTPHEPLTAGQVRHIAGLCRLALTDAEIDTERARLSAVLGYAERLAGLALDGVEPLLHPTLEIDDEATLRGDEPGAPFDAGVIESLAPDFEGGFVRIPKVLGQDGSGPGGGA